MVGHPHISDDLDRMETLGFSEDAENDLVELLAGPQKETALHCAAGDFDEGSPLWDEP